MKEKKEKKKRESNPKIDSIVNDYPNNVKVHPKENFEEQLKEHLIKHNVK
jgi:hypothetical protein